MKTTSHLYEKQQLDGQAICIKITLDYHAFGTHLAWLLANWVLGELSLGKMNLWRNELWRNGLGESGCNRSICFIE